MSNEADLTTAVATEIAKQLPIKDALQAPARQTGEILQDIVKTVQLALAPIQLAGALQDRLRHFLDESVRRVPEKDRLTPPPQVLGPIIEAIRYEPDGTYIDVMFSELLSASMDKMRVKDAHPAFVAIIRSLSSDEAKLLKAIANQPLKQTFSQQMDMANQQFAPAVVEAIELPDGLDYPGNSRAYFAHLEQLGLVGEQPQKGRRSQEAVLADGNRQTGLRTHNEFFLTIWGQLFMKAVTPKETR